MQIRSIFQSSQTPESNSADHAKDGKKNQDKKGRPRPRIVPKAEEKSQSLENAEASSQEVAQQPLANSQTLIELMQAPQSPASKNQLKVYEKIQEKLTQKK